MISIDTTYPSFGHGVAVGIFFTLLCLSVAVWASVLAASKVPPAKYTKTPPPPPLASLRGKYITHKELAEALDCFWNAAIVAVREDNKVGLEIVGPMAEGFAAVSRRLREIGEEI